MTWVLPSLEQTLISAGLHTDLAALALRKRAKFAVCLTSAAAIEVAKYDSWHYINHVVAYLAAQTESRSPAWAAAAADLATVLQFPRLI